MNNERKLSSVTWSAHLDTKHKEHILTQATMGMCGCLHDTHTWNVCVSCCVDTHTKLCCVFWNNTHEMCLCVCVLVRRGDSRTQPFCYSFVLRPHWAPDAGLWSLFVFCVFNVPNYLFSARYLDIIYLPTYYSSIYVNSIQLSLPRDRWCLPTPWRGSEITCHFQINYIIPKKAVLCFLE